MNRGYTWMGGWEPGQKRPGSVDALRGQTDRESKAFDLLRGLVATFPIPWDTHGYCRFCYGGYEGYDGREDYHDAGCIYEDAKTLLKAAGEEVE